MAGLENPTSTAATYCVRFIPERVAIQEEFSHRCKNMCFGKKEKGGGGIKEQRGFNPGFLWHRARRRHRQDAAFFGLA